VREEHKFLSHCLSSPTLAAIAIVREMASSNDLVMSI
jgi:hypothetical protein